MLSEALLQDLLSDSKYSQIDHILFCIAFKHPNALDVKDIRSIGTNNGFKRINKIQVSSRLSASQYAIKIHSGWKLNSKGEAHIAEILGPLAIGPSPQISTTLRDQLDHVTDENSKRFLSEAIACFEAGLWRAAVVFSWVGAVSFLQDYILQSNLGGFNQSGKSRFPKNWKNVVTKDDFAKLREVEFLQVAYDSGLLSKPIWLELKSCLTLRNNCGHPNTFSVGQNRASGHIESLISNVFAKYH